VKHIRFVKIVSIRHLIIQNFQKMTFTYAVVLFRNYRRWPLKAIKHLLWRSDA